MTQLAIATFATIIGGVATYFILQYIRQRGDREWIRYRSLVKLIHESTGQALHSHSLPLYHPGSSGQQQVTCYGGADSNDYWRVKAPHGYDEFAKKGLRIATGSVLRLEHYETRKNLHSHDTNRSPVSGQQEISAFGTDGSGDTNDNWRVDLQDGGDWLDGQLVRLVHVNTGAALHSHKGIEHPSYTAGQQEVTGYSERNRDDLWRALLVRGKLK